MCGSNLELDDPAHLTRIAGIHAPRLPSCYRIIVPRQRAWMGKAGSAMVDFAQGWTGNLARTTWTTRDGHGR